MVTKAIFFDLDDTLIDSGKAIIGHHLKTAKILCRRIPSTKEIAFVIGMPWDKVLEKIWPDEDNDEFKRIYLSIPKDIEIKPIKDVRATLANLRAVYKLGIITGRHKESAIAYLKEFKLHDLFEKIVTGSDAITKPDPSVFDLALDGLDRIARSEIIFVGDSMIDANCALRGNIKFIGVETGFFKKQDFHAIGVNNVLPNVNHILKSRMFEI